MTEPTIPQPRDDSGQFVSIATLFERERVAHERDHETERLATREIAHQLGREVEESAQRLERSIEKEALRSAADVRVALLAVAETARVHAEAHNREHQSHERIHAVEKVQVDKAEAIRDRDAIALSLALNEYKTSNNEWRGALRDQTDSYTTRQQFERVAEDLKTVQTFQVAHPGITSEVMQQALSVRDDRISGIDKRLERVVTREDGESRDRRLAGLESRLDKQAGDYVVRPQFDTEHERLIAIEKKMAYYAGAAAVSGATIALIIRLLGVGN